MHVLCQFSLLSINRRLIKFDYFKCSFIKPAVVAFYWYPQFCSRFSSSRAIHFQTSFQAFGPQSVFETSPHFKILNACHIHNRFSTTFISPFSSELQLINIFPFHVLQILKSTLPATWRATNRSHCLPSTSRSTTSRSSQTSSAKLNKEPIR